MAAFVSAFDRLALRVRLAPRWKMLWATFAIVFFGLCVFAFALSSNAEIARDQSIRMQRSYAHTHEILLLSEQLDTSLNQALRGERGYILTADPAFRTTFDTARISSLSLLSSLISAAEQDTIPDPELAGLDRNVREYLQLLDQQVGRVQAGQRHKAIELVRARAETRLIERARNSLKAIKHKERLRLAAHETANDAITAKTDTYRLLLVAFGWTLIGAVGLIGVFALHSRNQALDKAQALRAKQAELREARDAAEAAAKARAELLANISHEIRTPLQAMMGFAELLATSALPQPQLRHAELLRDSSRRLLLILNDVLEFARTEARRIDLQHTAFRPCQLAADCLDLVRAAADAKDISLSFKVDADLPDTVSGDQFRIQQILLNLLVNAIKFTERGRVTVTVYQVVADGKEQLAFAVSDTGVGIPTERQAKVFEPFSQADATIAATHGGSGLGLSISQNLAAAMGGSLELSSVEGVGTSVCLTIPLRPHALQESETTQLAFARRGAGEPILVVDDDPIIRELLSDTLGQADYRVRTASNGLEALRLLNETDYRPSVVIMDVRMPVMDGLLAATSLRQIRGWGEDVAIIGLTANALPADIEACRAAGMNHVLSKPVSASDLLEMVGGYVSDRRSLAAFDLGSLAPVYAERKRQALGRLDELIGALTTAPSQGVEEILREASNVAHQIAGVAATFGEHELGSLAKSVSQRLASPSPPARSDARLQIERLAAALGDTVSESMDEAQPRLESA